MGFTRHRDILPLPVPTGPPGLGAAGGWHSWMCDGVRSINDLYGHRPCVDVIPSSLQRDALQVIANAYQNVPVDEESFDPASCFQEPAGHAAIYADVPATLGSFSSRAEVSVPTGELPPARLVDAAPLDVLDQLLDNEK